MKTWLHFTSQGQSQLGSDAWCPIAINELHKIDKIARARIIALRNVKPQYDGYEVHRGEKLTCTRVLSSVGQVRWEPEEINKFDDCEKQFKLYIPTNELTGTIDYRVRASKTQTLLGDGLWSFNKSLEHDGNGPVTELPAGSYFVQIG